MFLMIGLTDGKKDLKHTQTTICDRCGKYGKYQVFMTYTALTLFFIPWIKWNRQYFVKASCCGTVYELDPETGEDILYGDKVKIKPKHFIRVVHAGHSYSYKRCGACGFETEEDFEFCPKCGNRFLHLVESRETYE